jgi:hypothetical protein
MRYLVGAVEHEWMIFPFSWEWKMIPTDELHHFSEGRLNHQPGCVWGLRNDEFGRDHH